MLEMAKYKMRFCYYVQLSHFITSEFEPLDEKTNPNTPHRFDICCQFPPFDLPEHFLIF